MAMRGETIVAVLVTPGVVKVANAGTAAVTKAVVASAVVLLPGDWVTPIVPVGRVGVPVKVGLARLALPVMSAATRNDEGFPTQG